MSDLNIYAQEIQVSYKAVARHVRNSDQKIDNMTSQLAGYCNKVLPQVNFISISNNSINKVFYEEAMTSDFDGEIWLNTALLIAIDGKYIYTDYSARKSYYESDQIAKIRSVNIDNLVWTITNETKKILDYVCYKATASIVDGSEEDTLTPPTIAWFSPELSLRGGPTAYATLPGIILELESQKIKFTAVGIKHKKDSSLELPDYDSKDILSHKEWNAYFSANNPISRLKN